MVAAWVVAVFVGAKLGVDFAIGGVCDAPMDAGVACFIADVTVWVFVSQSPLCWRDELFPSKLARPPALMSRGCRSCRLPLPLKSRLGPRPVAGSEFARGPDRPHVPAIGTVYAFRTLLSWLGMISGALPSTINRP